MITYKGKYTNAVVMSDAIDETASSQIIRMINNPSFTNPVVIMPDVHAGKGSVIGFTMLLSDRVIPDVVGVDICCQMLAMQLNVDLSGLDFLKLDKQVREVVPMGKDVFDSPKINMKQFCILRSINNDVCEFGNSFNKRYGTSFKVPEIDYDWFVDLCKRAGVDSHYAECSIGTLGGGKMIASSPRV